MPPKKIIDKGKGLAEPQDKVQTPSGSVLKIEPWITVTKKNPEKPTSKLQNPEEILDQMRQLQKEFERSFQNQEEGNSSKNPSLQISKIPEVSSKQLSKNTTSTAISKSSSNVQIVPKEFSQNPPSEYFEKSIFQNIITVEKDYFVENDPFLTIEKFFGKNQFYKPHNTEKTVLFYQTILDITDSVTFKHFYLDESHHYPAYSTFKIHDVIPPNIWNYELNHDLGFPESAKDLPCYNVKFNYWDYCQAWYNSFLVQSPKHSHTWLIFFDTTCDFSKAPNWFNQWWNNFGSVVEILKPQVQKSFQIFTNTYKPTKDEKCLNPLALFHSKFHLPYVFCWTLDFSSDTIPVLRRRFKVKWWNKCKIPSNLYPSNIPNWIKAQNLAHLNPVQIPPQTLLQTPETTLFLAQKSKMLSLLASASSEEEMKAISLSFLPNNQDCQSSNEDTQNPDLNIDDLDIE